MCYIDIEITPEMLAAADEFVLNVMKARATVTTRSPQTFLIAEFAFAQWFLGDWRRHNFRETNCETNFMDSTEIRSSARPFRNTLNLLAKQPYVDRRNADYYVCVIIDAPVIHPTEIQAGWICKICGWETNAKVKRALKRDVGKGNDRYAGYKSYAILISDLQPMSTFPLPRTV